MSISADWDQLRCDIALAEAYPIAYQVSGSVLSRNPILEQLLPSFLVIRIAAFVDDVLESTIDERHLQCPHLKENGGRVHAKGDLFNRTRCLVQQSLLSESAGDGLDRLRDRRRPLAHEPQAEAPTWATVRDCIRAAEAALAELHLIEPGGTFEAQATQHPLESLAGNLVQNYTVTVTKNGRRARELGYCLRYEAPERDA